MKPPPRQRIQPNRYDQGKHEQIRRRKLICTWRRVEQRGLLTALERLSMRPGATKVNVDEADLQKRVPGRTIPQLRSMVRELQARAVSKAAHQLLRQRYAERLRQGADREEKAVQLWRDMAAFVMGGLEDPISTAFSQMLVVSSTEPQTLCNSASAPLQAGSVQPTKTLAVAVGHHPHKSISQGAPPPFLIFNTPAAAALTPSTKPGSPSSVGAACVSPSTPAHGTPVAPSPTSPGAGCRATASAPKMLQLTQASGIAVATAKPGTRDPVEGSRAESQQEERSRWSVDFQKIYLYLANAQSESKLGSLTHMECAVVLDLLMALPEELPLLDCSKLRQHMTEAYTSLSIPAHSSGPRPERRVDPAGDPNGAANAAPRGDGVNSAAATAAGEDEATDGRRGVRAPAAAAALCPLNPFAVPLKLLVKRA